MIGQYEGLLLYPSKMERTFDFVEPRVNDGGCDREGRKSRQAVHLQSLLIIVLTKAI